MLVPSLSISLGEAMSFALMSRLTTRPLRFTAATMRSSVMSSYPFGSRFSDHSSEKLSFLAASASSIAR